MKVSLNIENDAELKAYIKDLIKGQVLSFTRDEYYSIVKEEIERKIKGTDINRFNTYFKDSMTNAIRDILRKDHNVSQWSNSFIKPIVEETINNIMRTINLNSIVNQAIKTKILELFSNK